ncbi:TPA: hypothetical protein I7117_14940 [Vibrio vulnificus]|uniref:hypothetical protein n=1 Tax=Vibrio navarrensis TaxID=29495 RepID=UPI0018DC7D34|nr:hypothetical protein [Vibrio navarrensis]MBH9739963.1 hypothetical protein [Vibrio navarrensis]HAS6100759.1 hypothetical protein [Vibrio vulnificus]HDY8121304.1 hypothetical protein [Vibrio vulnificus]
MGLGLSALARLFFNEPYEICHLETFSTQSSTILTCVDGSMVTVFKIDGVMRHYSDYQKTLILDHIANNLKEVFEDDGYKIDFIIDIDPDNAELFVKQKIGHIRENAIRYGYDCDSMLEEQEKLLIDNVKPEMQYVVVTTFIDALDALTRNEVYQERKKKFAALGLSEKKEKTEQSPLSESRQMFDQHNNFVNQVKSCLEGWLICRELEAQQVLYECRSLLYRDNQDFDKDWYADVVQQSPLRWRSIFPARSDRSCMGHPSIVSQLIDTPFEKTESNAYRYFDGKHITAITRHLSGSEKKPFSLLISSINRSIPFRLVYSLRSGTTRIKNKYSIKSSLATMVAYANPVTKKIVSACDEVVAFANDGGILVESYMSVATWGDSTTTVRSRYKSIVAMLRGWGGERHKLSEHPTETFLTTLPAFSRETTGVGSPMSLTGLKDGALQSAPLLRPCSPWEHGEHMYLTPEGKPWVHSYDDTQDYHMVAISGAMGSGKSVQVGVTLDAHVNTPGLPDLPLAGLVDYGPSGPNTVRGIKAKVAEKDKHKIEIVTLSNTVENAYNLLEPQYGYDMLTDREKAIVTAFVSKIVNGDGNVAVHSQLTSAIEALIDITLQERKKNPKQLDVGEQGADKIKRYCDSAQVRRFLDEEPTLTYQNARNALYRASIELEDEQQKAEFLAASRRAHVLSAPLLSELAGACKSQEADAMLGMFCVGDVKLTLIIEGAIKLAITRYPNILNRYPIKDYSQISILAVNVKPIVDASSKAMKYAWFILAKGLVTKHFWSHEDDIAFVNPVFRSYALEVASRKGILPKMYLQDEYEQAQCFELDEDLSAETKTARKYKEIIVIATQNHYGIPPDLVALATNNFICNISGREGEDFIKKEFGLNDDEFSAIRPYVGKSGVVNGVGRGILYVGRIKATSSLIVQPIVSILPASRVWSLASDAEDVEVRERCLAYGRFNDVCVTLGRLYGYPSTKKLIKNASLNEGLSAEDVYQKCENEFRDSYGAMRS